MADMLGLMKQAQAMQARMQEMQADMERLMVEGSAGGGRRSTPPRWRVPWFGRVDRSRILG